MARPLVPIAAGVLLLGAVACSGGSSEGTGTPAAGCGDVVRERFDPDSAVHVLPGADEPTYLTDPPTSGPHAPTTPVGGVRDEPIGRPDQVGLLEAGIVLVQHDRSVTGEELAGVEALADDALVVVAPNPDLPAPIVATAWTRKLLCTTLDDGGAQVLGRFVDEQAGQAPGSDG